MSIAHHSLIGLASLGFLGLVWSVPALSQEDEIVFEPEDTSGIPAHNLDVDMYEVVAEILNEPERAKEDAYNRFGEIEMAEVLRVLAGWRDEDAASAYEQLMAWNVEFFFEFDEGLQKRFASNVVDLQGPGAARVRADLAMSILDALENELSAGAMNMGARHLSELVTGAEGAKMILFLETRALRKRVQPLIAHILIYNPGPGPKVVGEMLGQVAYQVALQVRGGEGGDIFVSKEDIAKAQARLLGRTLAHVDLALKDWAVHNDEGLQPSAAHGASIVRFALGAIDTLTGGLSSSVTRPIRTGVNWLEDYETSLEEPPEDPAAELRKLMFEAVVTPFEKVITDDASLEEEEIQIMVERFREDVEDGHESSWGL